MAQGKVKWFNNAKGFGFIQEDGSERDIFVHYSSIVQDGYKSLEDGDEVIFDLCEGEKGLHAANVSRAVKE